MPFNQPKATQAAARRLKSRGGRMSYMKLIKLLYLADREALARSSDGLAGHRDTSHFRDSRILASLSLPRL